MDPVAEIGASAPPFELPDIRGGSHRLSDYRGRIVVLEFWSAKCPWSARVDEDLAEQRPDWGDQIVLVHIASNVDEGVEGIREVSEDRGLSLILVDSDQRVADAYGAQTTPQFFLIDAEGMLRYQGSLDDADFRQREATQHYLMNAISAVMKGEEPDPAETAPYGCALVRFEPKGAAE